VKLDFSRGRKPTKSSVTCPPGNEATSGAKIPGGRSQGRARDANAV